MKVTQLTIEELGSQGDGAHLGSKGAVFVDRAVPGDRIKAQLYKDERGISRGEIIEILQPSPHRQKAPCVYYDRCGGCTLQQLTPEFYRRSKVEFVKEALRKQGLRPRLWLDTVFVGDRSRRRATFSAMKMRNKITMGYYRRRSDEIGDIDSCLVADPILFELRELIKPSLETLLKNGEAVDFFLQLVNGSVDMVITGPIGRSGEPDDYVREAITKWMKASSITRVSWRAHEKEEIRELLNKGPIAAPFGPLSVNLPAAAFLQPTRQGEEALVKAVLGGLPQKGKFADLFAGCGTFSGPMLSRGPVDSYESLPRAVTALSKAAGRQPLKVFRRDLFKNPLRRDELNRYDAVVFDPPRAGCSEQAVQMAVAKTGTLVGVSCNPGTFARDAGILCEGGYWLQSVQIIDQFLWSHHVEVVGVFTKQKRGRSR